MLDSRSRGLLNELITKLRQGEHNIEILRIVLCENPDFDPYQAFHQLCTVHTGSLIPKDIFEFLSAKGISASDTDLYLLVKQYSSELNGRMSLDDFFQLVLPSTNPTLRSIASGRCLAHRRRLSSTVEFSIAKVLESELNFQRDLEIIKAKIANQTGFSTLRAFNTLDRRSKGFISEDDLVEFCRDYGILLLEQDLDDILRRLDTEEDGVLTYNEFLDFLLPLNESKSGISSERSFSKDQTKKEIDASKLEIDKEINSQTNKSDVSDKDIGFETPIKKENLKPDVYETTREKENSSENNYKLNDVFKTQLFSVRKIEFAKQNLAILEDFSVFSLFKQIDIADNGSISLDSLRNYLEQLELSYSEVSILFKNYGRDEDTIDIDRFKILCSPRDLEYAEILLSRQGVNDFNQFTLKMIKEFFEVLIENDLEVENAKKKLQENSDFDIKEALKSMANDGNEEIVFEDFDSALRSFGIIANRNDKLAVFEQYDKYREGVVSFQDFAEFLGLAHELI